MLIRRLALDDEVALFGFYQALSPAVVNFYEPYGPVVTAEGLRQALGGLATGDELHWGLFDAEGRLVGHSFVRHLRTPQPVFGIGLMECAQGHGWGRRLMQTVLADCDSRGLPLVTLTVLKRNQRAEQLYASLGFTRCGEVKFREDADSWYMERTCASAEA